MNDHPLECICLHRSEPFQRSFAQQAVRILPLQPERALQVSDRGLIVSGETEAVVMGAVEVLRCVYGENLLIGDLTICHRQRAVIEEPYMGIRVLCPARHFEVVKADLMARGAVIADAEVMPPIAVVRATAALANLLGYSRHLAALTDGKAREVIWLSHYVPLAEARQRGLLVTARSADAAIPAPRGT